MTRGFSSLLIILLVVLITTSMGVAYYFLNLNSHGKIPEIPNHSDTIEKGSSATLEELFKTGQVNGPEDVHVIVNNSNGNLILFNSNGDYLAGCGNRRNFLVSPNRKIIAYTYENNLFFSSEKCRFTNQITADGKGSTQQYYGVEVSPQGWSPDSSKILYKVESMYGMSELLEDPTAETGLFLYDLSSQKKYKIRELDQANEYQFYSWLEGFNPFFYKFSPNEGEYKIYYLDPKIQEFKQFNNAEFSFGFSNYQSDISNDKSHIVWTYGDTGNFSGNNFSQIMYSTLDRTQDVQISPKGRWAEYQQPDFSPGNLRIKYMKTKTDNSSDIEFLVIYDLSTNKENKFPVNAKQSAWISENKIIFSDLKNSYFLNTDTGTVEEFMQETSLR